MVAQNPTALVTGANQGIGFGTCCQLAKLGYNLVLACRNEQNAQKAAQLLQQENVSCFEIESK
jgi:NAD(P)-dependent dehydrogenase (short-subunit alcohol dehydrogenase family)